MPVTPNYSWQIPIVTGDLNIWGTKLNTVFGLQDALVRGLENCNIGSSPPSTLQNGTLWLDTSGTNPQVLRIYDGTNWAAIGNLSTSAHTFTAINTSANDIGDYKISLQTANHGSWLLCNGAAVSRTTYATLYALGGGTGSWPFGQGDGTTTFNLPDLRGLVVAGAGLNANPFYSPPLSTRTIGQYLGEENHPLTVAELAPHQHNVQDGSIPFYANQSVSASIIAGGGFPYANTSAANTPRWNTDLTGGTGSPIPVVTPHNTMQPTSVAGNYFIYTGV